MDKSPCLTSTRNFVLDMRFSRGGAWAGVEDFIEQAYLELASQRKDEVLAHHAYELHFVLRRHRKSIPLAHASLTDIASGVEKTRNYPVDRAYRIVHGLVDFALTWQSLTGADGDATVVPCAVDDAQHLARRFIEELARRGPAGGIHVVEPSSDVASQALSPIDTSMAEEIANSGPEHLLDMDTVEEHHPVLIAYHSQRGDEAAAARVALRALCLYNHFGYYHESGSFADQVIPHLDELAGDDQEARWNYVGNVFQGLLMTGRLDEARHLVEEVTAPKLSRSDLRAKMHYLLGMVHLRYAAQKDVEQAERHLLAARCDIAHARDAMAPADHAFFSVFIDNGIAFLRIRQKRPYEAIELCRSGYELLERMLGDNEHRLHRSVLQYNTAQVYAMLGNIDESLRFYDMSIEMDPYYSEYYNESGNLLLLAGRPQEAMERYYEAVKYSAPYPEVFHNIGVCLARMNDPEGARDAFGRSLDLAPNQIDVLLMRAEVLDSLGANEDQLRDLNAALLIDPDRSEARVNRAVALFDRHEYVLALADMDRAIEVVSTEPDLYISRAEVHRAMGRNDLSMKDLEAAELLKAA